MADCIAVGVWARDFLPNPSPPIPLAGWNGQLQDPFPGVIDQCARGHEHPIAQGFRRDPLVLPAKLLAAYGIGPSSRRPDDAPH